MSNYAVQGETLTQIANAIRGKTGSDGLMTVASMASAIEGIPSGGGLQFAEIETTSDERRVTVQKMNAEDNAIIFYDAINIAKPTPDEPATNSSNSFFFGTTLGYTRKSSSSTVSGIAVSTRSAVDYEGVVVVSITLTDEGTSFTIDTGSAVYKWLASTYKYVTFKI